jgi:hypothetical protein
MAQIVNFLFYNIQEVHFRVTGSSVVLIEEFSFTSSLLLCIV